MMKLVNIIKDNIILTERDTNARRIKQRKQPQYFDQSLFAGTTGKASEQINAKTKMRTLLYLIDPV